MQPKTPVTDWTPYKVYAASWAAGIILLLIFNDFFGMINIPFISSLSSLVDLPTSIAITLFISTAPAAIVQGKNSVWSAESQTFLEI